MVLRWSAEQPRGKMPDFRWKAVASKNLKLKSKRQKLFDFCLFFIKITNCKFFPPRFRPRAAEFLRRFLNRFREFYRQIV